MRESDPGAVVVAARIAAEPPIPPGVTLGILGGAQLGRVLGFAARTLGYLAILDPNPDRPARAIAEAVAREALGVRIAFELDVVGTLTAELFLLRDGSPVVNELAPRVPNSGHWTIEGAATSQFEQHVRAICGLPLGSGQAHGPTAMVNLLGFGELRLARLSGLEDALADPLGHVRSRPRRARPTRSGIVESIITRSSSPRWPRPGGPRPRAPVALPPCDLRDLAPARDPRAAPVRRRGAAGAS